MSRSLSKYKRRYRDHTDILESNQSKYNVAKMNRSEVYRNVRESQEGKKEYQRPLLSVNVYYN